MSTSALNFTITVLDCIEFAASILVWPSSFASFFALTWRAYEEKQLIQSLPLLLSQLNTAFIWIFFACEQVGVFYLSITGEHLIKGDIHGFRDETLTVLLDTAIVLEPLNLFFYTWRFWATLEKEETNRHLKSFYFWFAWSSICLIPAAYYGVFVGYVVE